MYLFPETRPALQAFWVQLRDRLRDLGLDAPDELVENRAPMEIWADPSLVISQICNLPYRRYFRDRVTVIAGSDYGLSDCAPGMYRARFVVRKAHTAQALTDLDGATMAINEPDSHSGWGAAATWAQTNKVELRPILVTGSHERSIEAVADGHADVATIDAQTLEFLKRRATSPVHELRVLGSSPESPGMSFITRKGVDPKPFRIALASALEELPDAHRPGLALQGFPVLPEEAYRLPLPPKAEVSPK